MHFKRVFSFAIFVLFILFTITLFNSYRSEETIFFHSKHEDLDNKINLYPKSHKCATQCIEDHKGFNCGKLTQSCCKDEQSCHNESGQKKCINKLDFDCKIIDD